MSKCEHIIGIMGDLPVTDSDDYMGLRSALSYESRSQISLSLVNMLKGKPLTPREIADARRGYLLRFNYCPKCGEKLNWKQLIDKHT